jgi:hypothetical protein
MSTDAPNISIRLSLSNDVCLELDRMDNVTSQTPVIGVQPHRDPDKFLVSLKGLEADHVFLVDTLKATLQTIFFRTNGGLFPWSQGRE